jgi:transmembrane sensor
MEKKYQHIQDFLNDDRFVQWVLTGQNKDYWQNFLIQNPDQKPLLQKARRLLLDIGSAEGQSLPSLNQPKVWAGIRGNLQLVDTAGEAPPPRRRLYPALAWAASAVLLVGLGWLAWQHQPAGTITYQELQTALKEKNRLIEVTTGKTESKEVVLEDGSTITLGKNSRLSYPEHFKEGHRSVVLTGEAFFDIAKDRHRPFYIYTNEVVTKVLGTSFRIQALENDNQVVVQVKTGRVSVYSQQRLSLTDPESDGLIVLPNQQAHYSRTQQNLSRALVDQPVPVIPVATRQPVRYDEVSASKILRDLEAQYGIAILFNDDVLDHCILTTTLDNESLFNKLDLVCRTIGATYKEVDAQLIVESKGCQ